MSKITDYELGDLVESVDWFVRNVDLDNAMYKEDIPGPMGPKDVMKSLQKLVVEYDKLYKTAYITIPIPKFLQRFRRAKS